MSTLEGLARNGGFAVLVAALFALPLVVAPIETQARSLQEIVKDKKIRLGTIPYHPTTIVDLRSGELSGYYVDTLRDQFKKLGIEVEFVETKWGTFPGALQADQFDVFIGGSFATPQRALAVDFSRPFMYMGYSAGARAADAEKFKTIADIDKKGVKVAVVMGSGGHEYVKQNFTQAEVMMLDTGDLTAALMAVLAGRADVAIEDAVATAQVVAKQKALVDLFGTDPFNVMPISFALQKGNQDLLNFMNTLVDYMVINGKWYDAAGKWKADLGGFFQVDRRYRPVGTSANTGMIK